MISDDRESGPTNITGSETVILLFSCCVAFRSPFVPHRPLRRLYILFHFSPSTSEPSSRYLGLPRPLQLQQKSLPIKIWDMSDSSETLWSDNPNAPQIPRDVYLGEKSNFSGILIGAIFYGTPICASIYLCLYPALFQGSS